MQCVHLMNSKYATSTVLIIDLNCNLLIMQTCVIINLTFLLNRVAGGTEREETAVQFIEYL